VRGGVGEWLALTSLMQGGPGLSPGGDSEVMMQFVNICHHVQVYPVSSGATG